MDTPLTILLADASLSHQAFLGNLFPPECRLLNINSMSSLASYLASSDFRSDILLLSEELPGLDLGRFLQQWNPSMQQVGSDLVVLGRNEVELEVRALAYGASLYLPLPLTPELVEGRLGALLRQRRRMQLLESLSMTDFLTGIANRRRFNEVLTSEWRWSQREQRHLGLMVIDVDYFKGYNDAFGHQQGDRALQQIAQALAGAVNRPRDLLARYGGEEFAAIVPCDDCEGLAVVAQRMLQAVRRLGIQNPASSVDDCVSVSIGSAHMFADQGAEPEVLLTAADQALYAAKAAGRNQHLDASALPPS